VVNQYLVHHHLEEEWGCQTNQLQKERHQQHFAQQFAVFDDGRNKPAEIEAGQLARKTCPGCKQNQLAIPLCLPFLRTALLRSADFGVLKQDLLAIHPRQNDKLAVNRLRNRREWRARQAVKATGNHLGFKTTGFGCEQDFSFTHRLAMTRVLVADLVRLDGHRMKAGQHHKTSQCRIKRRRFAGLREMIGKRIHGVLLHSNDGGRHHKQIPGQQSRPG